MARQTLIFIVASLRSGVGKTLIARLLADYFRAEGRPVAAFDLDPEHPALREHLSALTTAVHIDDTRGEMRLFDSLVGADAQPKIVDLGVSQFDRFFAVARDIGFAREARTRGIVPVVLFVADGEPRSRAVYADLLRDFADLVPVPAINEFVPVAAQYQPHFRPCWPIDAPLAVPLLPIAARLAVERPGFSFAAHLAAGGDPPGEFAGWIRKMFLQFRDIEVRLLLDALDPAPQQQA